MSRTPAKSTGLRSLPRLAAAAAVVLGLVAMAVGALPATADTASGHANVLTIDGTIDPISANFLARGIDVATEREARLLVVRLNTPGGLLDSTRDMVASIQSSRIPVVVYVWPPGAQAASAGTFVTAAAHVAAMAPSTNIGAASPVGGQGQDLPETLKSKATQDAAAFIRSIAEQRGRNADALEETVLSAASYSASEALEQNIIDLVAEDMNDLMARLNGRTVLFGDREHVLETEGLALRPIERNLLERFLGIVAHPNIAFLLLSLGGLGLLLEFLNPGLIFPGVAGAIALALAFVAVGNLPVNWAGVALLGLAMLLFFFEMQAAGVGILGVGGAISFVLGAFLLFGGFSPPPIGAPSFRVSMWLISVVSGVLFVFLAIFFRTILTARRTRYRSPSADVVGKTGTATTNLEPHGSVRVGGERWTAESESGDPIREGQQVVVTAIQGLTVTVQVVEGETTKEVEG